MAWIAGTNIESVGSSAGPTVISPSAGQPVVLPRGIELHDATFARVGSDMVVRAADGESAVVRGFFDHAEHPQLLFEGGIKHISGDLAARLAGPLAPGQVAQAGAAALGNPIGKVENLGGTVTATHTDGTHVNLKVGDAVYQGDILESSAKGGIGVVLADETTFSMGPDGRMVLDEMIYDPGSQQGNVALSVLQGVFTFVSGHVAKTDPDAMVLETPVATIGIRGTQLGFKLTSDHMEVVNLPQPDGHLGEITISNAGGVTTLNFSFQGVQVLGINVPPGQPFTYSPQGIVNLLGSSLSFLPASEGANHFGVTPIGQADHPGDTTDGAGNQPGDHPGDQQPGETHAADAALPPHADVPPPHVPVVTEIVATIPIAQLPPALADLAPPPPPLELAPPPEPSPRPPEPEPVPGPPVGPPSGSFPAGSGLLVGDQIDDYHFTVTVADTVTIEVRETVAGANGAFVYDSEINLYRNDGSLDIGDFVAHDDDAGGGPSSFESLLHLNLSAGDYLLRIGNFDFEPSDLGATNPHFVSNRQSDYTLTISSDHGSVVTAFGDSGPSAASVGASFLVDAGGGSAPAARTAAVVDPAPAPSSTTAGGYTVTPEHHDHPFVLDHVA